MKKYFDRFKPTTISFADDNRDVMVLHKFSLLQVSKPINTKQFEPGLPEYSFLQLPVNGSVNKGVHLTVGR